MLNYGLENVSPTWSVFPATLAQRTPKPKHRTSTGTMQQSRSFSPHSMSLSALIALARSMSVSWSSPPKLSTQTRQEWMMEITPHARPPTVSTAAKDKVVCSMPRRKRKVATSRRASRADYVVVNAVQSASGKVAARDWTTIGRQIMLWGCFTISTWIWAGFQGDSYSCRYLNEAWCNKQPVQSILIWLELCYHAKRHITCIMTTQQQSH